MAVQTIALTIFIINGNNQIRVIVNQTVSVCLPVFICWLYVINNNSINLISLDYQMESENNWFMLGPHTQQTEKQIEFDLRNNG